MDAFCFHTSLQVSLGAMQSCRMAAFTANIMSCTGSDTNATTLQEVKLRRGHYLLLYSFIAFHFLLCISIFFYLFAIIAPASI